MPSSVCTAEPHVPQPATGEAEDEASLWRRLRTDEDPAAVRERLIHLHTDYARMLAAKLYGGRFHDEIGFDEYFQLACVGLIESVDRYDPARGAQFRTFASQRIQGSILSGLERLTEKQQQIALKKRLQDQRNESLREGERSGDLDRLAPDALLARLAEIGVGMAIGYLLEGSGMVQSAPTAPSAATAYTRIELRQLQEAIHALVDQLPEQERKVIRAHYLQQIPFEEIAEMMSLTRGRISQVHRKALLRLREIHLQQTPAKRAW